MTNKKFDVIEFNFYSFEEGIKVDSEIINKMSPSISCISGHRIDTQFYGSPLITKIFYSREFDCERCVESIKTLNDVVDKCIPINKPFTMRRVSSFMLKDPNDKIV